MTDPHLFLCILYAVVDNGEVLGIRSLNFQSTEPRLCLRQPQGELGRALAVLRGLIYCLWLKARTWSDATMTKRARVE